MRFGVINMLSLNVKGETVLIDVQDAVSLLSHFLNIRYKRNKKYVVIPHKNGFRSCYLHDFILSDKTNFCIDHVDGNPLNNLRSNLREADRSKNAINTGLKKTNKSGYKGVHFKTKGKWVAQITKNRKCHTLGIFSSAKEAAIAYNKAALELFGEYAWLNPI